MNAPSDYTWLEPALKSLCLNEGEGLGCRDLDSGKGYSPIFFVVGGCPNLFCGMQVVMYGVSAESEVDFWWVKPFKRPEGGALELERATLNRHSKGQHKNDPGRSKQFYKPLADLFIEKSSCEKEGNRFGIAWVKSAEGHRAPRAYLEKVIDGRPVRFYLQMVWQEDWTSTPFTRRKYIKGKLVYQKDPQVAEFYSRQYSIIDGNLSISEYEDEPWTSFLPTEGIKDLRDYENLR